MSGIGAIFTRAGSSFRISRFNRDAYRFTSTATNGRAIRIISWGIHHHTLVSVRAIYFSFFSTFSFLDVFYDYWSLREGHAVDFFTISSNGTTFCRFDNEAYNLMYATRGIERRSYRGLTTVDSGLFGYFRGASR